VSIPFQRIIPLKKLTNHSYSIRDTGELSMTHFTHNTWKYLYHKVLGLGIKCISILFHA